MPELPQPPAPTPAGPRSAAEVLADARLREALASYQPLHLEDFLQGYARVLQDLHYHGANYESNLEYLLHRHEKAAYGCLWAIQHQKLFDLECQWRAELVPVPGAQLTANFEDWHNAIEACRVVPPISPGELGLLDAFLAQLSSPDELPAGDLSEQFWLQRRFPHMRHDPDDPNDDREEALTAWTEFWDLHRGSSYLRELPDLRGTKEYRYEQAVRDENRRLHPPEPQPEDPRPHVPTWGSSHDELVRSLLRRFEPASSLRQFEAKQQLERDDDFEDAHELALALERLREAGPQLVPIEAHADWRQAIIAAANRHRLAQLRAALPRVYEAYWQRETLGISHFLANDSARRRPPREHFGWQAELIRKGRGLLGEPDDLNF